MKIDSVFCSTVLEVFSQHHFIFPGVTYTTEWEKYRIWKQQHSFTLCWYNGADPFELLNGSSPKWNQLFTNSRKTEVAIIPDLIQKNVIFDLLRKQHSWESRSVLPQLRETQIIDIPTFTLPPFLRNNAQVCCVHHVHHDPVLSHVLPLHTTVFTLCLVFLDGESSSLWSVMKQPRIISDLDFTVPGCWQRKLLSCVSGSLLPHSQGGGFRKICRL